MHIGALIAVAALAGAQGAATKTVAVDDYEFVKSSVSVKRGDAVRFRWRGEDLHNVRFTAVPKGASKPRRCGSRSDGSCKRKLRAAGTYRYVCTLHLPAMKGKVRVRP